MSRQVDLVARRRSASASALRWTINTNLPFPGNGFTVERFIDGAASTVVDAIRLPGAVESATGRWTIDDATLERDHASRAAPPGTPALPPLAELEAMRPILMFALPWPDDDALGAALADAAAMLGDSHEQDLLLRTNHWGNRPAPRRDELPTLRNGSPSLQRAYGDVIDHYRAQATRRLLLLASDYPSAILLGLGFEDELPDQLGNTHYILRGDWSGRDDTVYAPLDSRDSDWPHPPTLDEIVQGDGMSGYPGFAPFYAAGSTWSPSAPAGDALLEELVSAAQKGPRTCPAPTAMLRWRPSNNEEPKEELPPLLPRAEAEWRIDRHALGILPSVNDAPPELDSAAVFQAVHDADPLLRNKANSFEDDIDLPWGESVPEGWYAYRIIARDLFGISGPPSEPTLVCLRDRYAPRPPTLKLLGVSENLILKPGANSVSLTLDWDAGNELAAPDATEFRAYQEWTSIEHVPLEVRSVLTAPGELDAVQAEVEVLDPHGRPLAVDRLTPMAGGHLLTPNGEFAIISVKPQSLLRVRRSAGRAPTPGSASARYKISHAASDQIARLARQRAAVGSVRVITLSPLTVEVLDSASTAYPALDAQLYLHVIGSTFAARADGNGFVVDRPPEERRRECELYDQLEAVGMAAAAALLDGSPAIILPPHEIEVPLLPPSDFASGTVRLAVSAADATSYVETRQGQGNEGARSDLLIVARQPAAPAPTPRRVPRQWAKDAAEFVQTAEANVTWPRMEGAVRYELERALEPALGLTPSAEDDALLAAAATASPTGFERVTNAAFLPRWTDQLPGRSPTRAVYRVRGVSGANTPGNWQVVALVRVPDVRIPPRSSLLSATPTLGTERAVTCCWTQGGELDGIGFMIESRTAAPVASEDERWELLADLLPRSIEPDSARRFSTVLPGCSPGEARDYRVTAVRHAPDPADPRARNLRRIMGRPSNIMRTRAIGELLAPEKLSADVGPSGTVTLRWRNTDRYVQLELRRRQPGGLGLVRRALDVEAQSFREPDRLLEPGEWTYELAAIGHGRRSLSAPLTVLWKAP